MKIRWISALVLTILILSLVFVLMIYQPGAGMYVRADQLPEKPEKYMEYTLEELEKYPYVKEAIQNPGKEIRIPFNGEYSDTDFCRILWDNRTGNIKVGAEYYAISCYSAD